jgi:FlaG/FlaF family flagellin (archaellin)
MKGVSIIIATILILMISVSLTAFAYMFMTQMMSATTETGLQTVEKATSSLLAEMKIESMDESNNKIYVKNSGRVNLTQFYVFINDALVSSSANPETIAPGEITTISISSLNPGDVVKVTSSHNAVAIKSIPSTETCPDGFCDDSENEHCPADASSCPEPAVCYLRTCVNGCNNPPSPIASGSQDNDGSNLCNNAQGCASPPCQCDGAGNCELIPVLGLVAHWNFNEGYGLTAGDSSGNGLDGTLVNNPEWIFVSAGNYALRFTNDYITINDPTAKLDLQDSLSVEAWIYPEQIKTGIVFAHGYSSSAPYVEYAIGIGSEAGYQRKIGFWMNTGPSTTHELLSSQQYNINSLYYVVGTWDGSFMRLFINGTQENFTSVSGTIDEVNQISLIASGVSTQYFNGIIDEVKIWDRALTAPEILAAYNSV